MKNWLSETLIIFAYSKRTQWAIIIACLGFIGINLWGDYQLSNFELSGIMSSFEDVIKDKLLQRYDKVALGWLIAFIWLAIKQYKKDKKKFYNSF